MSEFLRYHIRAGDTTTADGRVEPKPQSYPCTYDGALMAFESDPVWCPACKSYGVIKCVPPFRPNTGTDGRQRSLDGDLCLCKCSIPPRLIAKFKNSIVRFSAGEITGMDGSAAWMAYAGHTMPVQVNNANVKYGRVIQFTDDETGEILANRKFIINHAGAIQEAKTDAKGYAIIETPQGQTISIHLVFEAPAGKLKQEI